MLDHAFCSSSVYIPHVVQISPEISDELNSVISVRTAQTLANIPFFKSVKENKPWSKLGILGSMFQFEHFVEGATVVKEGEIGDKVTQWDGNCRGI
jgi:hypothetical protein